MGGKPRWSEEDLETVEQWLNEERRYTSRQLCQLLKQERGVKLGTKQLSRILKKRCDPAEVSSARERVMRSESFRAPRQRGGVGNVYD